MPRNAPLQIMLCVKLAILFLRVARSCLDVPNARKTPLRPSPLPAFGRPALRSLHPVGAVAPHWPSAEARCCDVAVTDHCPQRVPLCRARPGGCTGLDKLVAARPAIGGVKALPIWFLYIWRRGRDCSSLTLLVLRFAADRCRPAATSNPPKRGCRTLEGLLNHPKAHRKSATY